MTPLKFSQGTNNFALYIGGHRLYYSKDVVTIGQKKAYCLTHQYRDLNLKNMLNYDTIPLSSYMATMGALNLKLDAKTD